jgi:hypothetical protein
MKNTAISTRGLIDHWRHVGPKLDRIRRKELRDFDQEKQAGVIDALLEIACGRATPRITSGLVKMQRLLAKT